MTRNFLIGFAGGLLLFIAINLIVAHLTSDCGLPAVFGLDACADDIARAGWPLQFYEEGGFIFRRQFSLLFFLLNFMIGNLFALACGWLLSHIKRPLSK